jgi:hypothetical protein
MGLFSQSQQQLIRSAAREREFHIPQTRRPASQIFDPPDGLTSLGASLILMVTS